VIQKIRVVNDCRKVDRIGQQVRVEKRNESEPLMTHRKLEPLSEPRGLRSCGISWERGLLIDPATAGVEAASARLTGFYYGTREL
jgi:hypothetical protein